jgi:subtilisin-like proprotein convertase family protein
MREAAEARSVLVVALAVAVCLLALVATSPAEAAGSYRTVTKTFSNPAGVQTPDAANSSREGIAAPYPSEVSVAGLRKGRVLDVNLKINDYSHTCAEDLDVLLVSPGGRNAIPMSDMPACSAIQGVNLTLDDEGASPWPAPLVSGAYVPTDNDATGNDAFPAPPGGGSAPPQDGGPALSAFDGTNPNGVWKLYVVDDTIGSAGQFAGGWSLTIKAKVRR